MPHIRHTLLINVSAEKIYNAITTQEGLSVWWTPDANVKPEVDSVARFAFGPSYFKEMKITELTPSRKVTWICIAGAEEWIGTTISFQLQAGDKETLLNSHPEMIDQIQQQTNDGDGTLLIFQHNNWKEYTPMFAECNYTWGRFLRSLKLFCETGKGMPWPNQHRILM
ncbi:MAG TPA: SRPBCC domain-containing protein [Flavitalea sp.]|nr:SRPBCC domain-containing protein [Flavitalea sp.]